MPKKYLIYNFSGELDDISHLFPNERLGRIAAIIIKYGCEADIVDRANISDLISIGKEYMRNLGELSFYESNKLYESLLEKESRTILDNDYDVIFINLWHGSGSKFSIDLSNLIKKSRPMIKIYGVGQKVDWFKEYILKLANNRIDGLIMGLGYNAVEDIVLNKNLTKTANLILSNDGKITENKRSPIDVDNFPLALYHPDIYKNIKDKIPVFSITLSNQACPNHCIFCVRPENYGRINKARKIENVIAEMTQLRLLHKAAHFRIEDSTPPRNSFSELAQAIINSKLHGKVKFSGFSRIDTNNPKTLALLKEAGCAALFFGIESLDDENLLKLRKGITYSQIKNTLMQVHKSGIPAIGSFIFPIPGETRQSMENTLQRMGEVGPYLSSLLVLPAGVYPHTEWGKHPAKYGIQLEDDYLEKSVIYPLKYLLPFKYWPPFSFKYKIMDKDIKEVNFAYIVKVYQEFLDRIKNEFHIPAIPDYYFLLSDLIGKDYIFTTQTIIGYMVHRDYPAIKELFSK